MGSLTKCLLGIRRCTRKKYQRCTFASDGSGVPLIIKNIAEMESSDDLRSELCTTFLSGMDYVKSYGSSKFRSGGLVTSIGIIKDFQYASVVPD